MSNRIHRFICFTVILFLTFHENSKAQSHPGFNLVRTKSEQGGQNVMELYSYSGEIDASALKTFCLERKSKSTARGFYYLVVFDAPGNARFPSSPFTAEYGVEEDVLKHIRAIYVYNRVNGFSELRYHDANIWDYSPKYEKL